MSNSGYSNSGDGKIDWRIKAFAIPILIILAFLLGDAVLGPWWNSRQGNGTDVARNQIPPSPSPAAPAPKKTSPKVDVEITETPAKPTDQATSDQPGVKKDDNGLTVTLDPNSDAAKPGVQNPSADNEKAQPNQAGAGSTENPKNSPAANGSGIQENSRISASTPAGKGPFRVQAGTFASQASADSLAADLQDHGYNAEVKTTQVEDRVLYRVQIGEYKSKASADQVAARLKAGGYSPTVMPAR